MNSNTNKKMFTECSACHQPKNEDTFTRCFKCNMELKNLKKNIQKNLKKINFKVFKEKISI